MEANVHIAEDRTIVQRTAPDDYTVTFPIRTLPTPKI